MTLEPHPTAKAIIVTSSGDLELSLFGKQAPLATQNFLQHCLDGYYNGTVFHRLVPGFILQGGDPTGTGSGGVSALDEGDDFDVEIHSRLKFNRRGLLGMVEKDGKNGSQFFFTLAPTPELQGKCTLFGRVEGDTVFNLVHMGEAEVDGERPLWPVKIIRTEVVVDPFNLRKRAKAAAEPDADDKAKKRKRDRGKKVGGLSFEDDENEVVVLKKNKVNHKAEKSVAINKIETQLPVRKTPPIQDAPDEPAKERSPSVERDPSSSPERETELEKTKAEIAALKASMKRADPTKEQPKTNTSSARMALKDMVPAKSTRGRRRGKDKGTDEPGAAESLLKFMNELNKKSSNDESKKPANANKDAKEEGEAEEEDVLCDLHLVVNCASCQRLEEQERTFTNGMDWTNHKLTCEEDVKGRERKWRENMEDVRVEDVRK
ncbi:cyclophilin-like protein [Piedraia hortae CBS 480.64]|uniref:Cyclophilin-like protein n=1 Tax=Piedraia hortae CBS 480.64 TaxID=1314780 RepID=A0A6A7BUL7_9PEZI|nr:cyclophilin-like protein [Piedraia hortae CBS 480.64]